MDRKQLESRLVACLSKNLKKESRFYAEDLANIKRAVAQKTVAELRASLGTWTAVAAVSTAEINRNCQFKGLL